MVARAFGWLVLLVTCSPLLALAQEARPVPPDQNLPPHIRRLTWFGERAEFSRNGKRVLFLSRTLGDAMEVEIETGIIRNLTAFYPHHGYTRAMYRIREVSE